MLQNSLPTQTRLIKNCSACIGNTLDDVQSIRMYRFLGDFTVKDKYRRECAWVECRDSGQRLLGNPGSLTKCAAPCCGCRKMVPDR